MMYKNISILIYGCLNSLNHAWQQKLVSWEVDVYGTTHIAFVSQLNNIIIQITKCVSTFCKWTRYDTTHSTSYIKTQCQVKQKLPAYCIRKTKTSARVQWSCSQFTNTCTHFPYFMALYAAAVGILNLTNTKIFWESSRLFNTFSAGCVPANKETAMAVVWRGWCWRWSWGVSLTLQAGCGWRFILNVITILLYFDTENGLYKNCDVIL